MLMFSLPKDPKQKYCLLHCAEHLMETQDLSQVSPAAEMPIVCCTTKAFQPPPLTFVYI